MEMPAFCQVQLEGLTVVHVLESVVTGSRKLVVRLKILRITHDKSVVLSVVRH